MSSTSVYGLALAIFRLLPAFCVLACGVPHSGDDHIVLSADRSAQIWKAEQYALLLQGDVLPEWLGALREHNGKKIDAFLASDFSAEIFAGPGTKLVHGNIHLESWRRPEEGPRGPLVPETPSAQVGREEFIASLLELSAHFVDAPTCHFHITRLVADDSDSTWHGTWQLEVLGTLPDGIRVQRQVELDVVLSQSQKTPNSDHPQLQRCVATRSQNIHSPGSLMEEITTETGIDTNRLGDNWANPGPPYPEFRGSASLFDMDQDGVLDLLVDSDRHLDLYRGLGTGRFEDVTRAAQVILPHHSRVRSATVADLNNDGFEDILADIAVKNVGRRTLVFENVGGSLFRVLPDEEHNLQGVDLRSAAIADYDLDGRVDLYLPFAGDRSDDAEGSGRRWLGDRSGSKGVLLRNLGEWRFEDVTAATSTSGGFTPKFGAVWADLEPDGDADLFLANHMGPNILLENHGPDGFRPREQPRGFGGFGMGVTAGDLDEDGDPDFYVANMYSSAGSRIIGNLQPTDYPPGIYEIIRGFVTGNELYVNGPGEELRAIGSDAGVAIANWGYGPMVVDLDGDGHLDLYAPSGHQSVTRGKPDG